MSTGAEIRRKRDEEYAVKSWADVHQGLDGVLRWKSNDQCPMSDMLATWRRLGFVDDVAIEATNAARGADTTADQAVADLLSRGYVHIDEVAGIRVGDRVHHIGQRWWQARQEGTATVVAVTENVGSAWAQKYGARDVELVVLRDKPIFEGMSRVSTWANYHTGKALS